MNGEKRNLKSTTFFKVGGTNLFIFIYKKYDI